MSKAVIRLSHSSSLLVCVIGRRLAGCYQSNHICKQSFSRSLFCCINESKRHMFEHLTCHCAKQQSNGISMVSTSLERKILNESGDECCCCFDFLVCRMGWNEIEVETLLRHIINTCSLIITWGI